MLPPAGVIVAEPNWPIMLPFGILLLAIALGPLIAPHQWERHYPKLCIGLAGLVCVYYLFAVNGATRVVHAGFDYGTFMVVVGSFFVVSGGIHLRAKAPSSPGRNTLFLFFGALLANLIGTIGASMLLIRPWIEMNRERFAPRHIAFFIFMISNIGGALLPVGPPLFLGLLKGVPFWWTLQHCWGAWLVTVAIVLILFFVLDAMEVRPIDKSGEHKWHCDGARNFVFLLVLLGALVAVPEGWREPVMVLIAFGSYLGTPKPIREANHFTFGPLKEVGWLFLGIFGTMIPVLEYMEGAAGKLGLHSDVAFYWSTGLLSGVLDNAPTYLALFAAALGLHGYDINNPEQIARFISEGAPHLMAISLGATCFGALTYIGNAPNLLVKAIAEQARVPTPSFLGYIWKFALPILIPTFALVSFLFFSR